MERKKIKEIRTLIVRLGTLAILFVIGYFLYTFFAGEAKKAAFEIDETPLKVEQIRSILELNTLKFQDETVVDTIEWYASTSEQVAGTFEKLFSYDQMKNGIISNGIKRRLSLIVKGELLYGVNLKTKDFSFKEQGDSIIVTIPQPELLSISVNPNNTEIFVENGFWKDYEKQQMVIKAKNKMIRSGLELKLSERAKTPLLKLLQQLIKSDKKVVIQFEQH
jgi:hypothetical protein